MWCERCALLLHEGGEECFASPESQLIAVHQLHIRIRLGRRGKEGERREGGGEGGGREREGKVRHCSSTA